MPTPKVIKKKTEEYFRDRKGKAAEVFLKCLQPNTYGPKSGFVQALEKSLSALPLQALENLKIYVRNCKDFEKPEYGALESMTLHHTEKREDIEEQLEYLRYVLSIVLLEDWKSDKMTGVKRSIDDVKIVLENVERICKQELWDGLRSKR